MKSLKSNHIAVLFTLLFLFIGLTMNAQMHPPKNSKEKVEASADEEYFFHAQFDKKHNFKLERMLSKKLGKSSGLSSKATKIWKRIGGKKVPGFHVAVSKGDIKIKYDKLGGKEMSEDLKSILVEITNMVYSKDGTFKMSVKGEL